MITKNYYVARRTYDTSTTTSGSVNTTPYTVKSMLGTEYSGGSNGLFASTTQGGRTMWNTSRLSVYLGTGTTPETADDYCLDNDITSTLTGVTFSVQTTVSLEMSRYCYKSVLTISFSNTTGAAVDITEVGLAGNWIFSGDAPMLLFRKVINPVHLENNQSTTIVLNWFDF